jgi:hypothetical protein
MFSLRKVPAALLAAAFVVATAVTSSTAQSLPEGPAQTQATTICTPLTVAEFPNRIHIHCTVAVSGISYFAVATSDPSRAAHALALFATALASGHDVRIFYDAANTNGTAIGCLAADCRLADGVELL